MTLRREIKPLVFVRVLLADLKRRDSCFSPALHDYLFDVVRTSAVCLSTKSFPSGTSPETIDLAFALSDEQDLLEAICKMNCTQDLDTSMADRILLALQRFSLA